MTKRFLLAAAILVLAGSAFAAPPPLLRNWATTNDAPALTNIITSIAGASGGADKMATNAGTSWSGTFYNPTFADEVGSATINELTVSGALILGSSGSVIFGTNNAPLLNYAPSLLTWTIPVTFTNASGSRVAFLDDIGPGGGGGSIVTWDPDTMILEISGSVTVVDWDSDTMVLTLSY